MKTLKDAISLIMAQPPELHYPAYFADLLRKADIPDENVGNCSEIPNSSDTIYRQAALDCVTYDVESTVERIKELPSAKPQIIRCKECKHWTNNIGDSNLRDDFCNEAVHGFYYRCSGDDYCSKAERRTDD